MRGLKTGGRPTEGLRGLALMGRDLMASVDSQPGRIYTRLLLTEADLAGRRKKSS